MPDDTQRTIGEHGGRLSALERDIKDLKIDMRSIADKLDEANAKLDKASGGLKTMMLLGGGAATFGGLVVEGARLLLGHH